MTRQQSRKAAARKQARTRLAKQGKHRPQAAREARVAHFYRVYARWCRAWMAKRRLEIVR